MIFTASFPVPPAPRAPALPCTPVESDAVPVSPAAMRYLAIAFVMVSALAGTAVVLPLV